MDKFDTNWLGAAIILHVACLLFLLHNKRTAMIAIGISILLLIAEYATLLYLFKNYTYSSENWLLNSHYAYTDEGSEYRDTLFLFIIGHHLILTLFSLIMFIIFLVRRYLKPSEGQ